MRPLPDLLGESPGIEAIRDRVMRLLARQQDARRLPPVLIEGETGTGKGLLARMIHRAGPRPQGPFVDVNCAAIPETLLEAEMFGFERGAFTDARRAKPGLLQAANRGTIFLDEVALLSEGLQAKLLKVLEERSVRRLGSTRDEPIDVWILTATNENLKAAIAARRFREDLYHRLAVLTLSLPPLRTRGGDILLLAEHYLGRACADYGISAKMLAADARAALRAYPWPGNVRELSNLMERVALLSSDPEVTAGALGLPTAVVAAPSAPASINAASSLDDAVRDRVVEVLRQTGWNISRTASLLGISRNTLRARIEKYDLRQGEGATVGPRAERRTRAAGLPVAIPPVVPRPAGLMPVRWERRRVTLLRVTLTAALGTETPLGTSRSLEVILDKIKTFGGRIEGRSPTGVVAVFGLDSIEDVPSQAAHAAMAIRNAITRSREDPGPSHEIRIAIHVAQFLVGQGAGAAELDVETKQSALATLEALIGRAEPDGIVIGDAAAPFLERGFELRELGSSEPARGRVFALAGRERTGSGRSRRLAIFVGRHRELELLWSRLESTVRGQGQVLGISGEAGIGKSRLLFEFRESLAGKPVTYIEGQCRSFGAAIPYLPILDILRTMCGIGETDTPGLMAEKVRAGLLEAGLDLVETAPPLLHLLGVEPAAERGAALEPNVTKARVFETLRQIALKRSQQRPLVIVVEDAHWIDQSSEECIAALAGIVAGARLLLVSTYRPGHRPSWIDTSYTTQVALQPLAPEDSQRVLRSVLGEDHATDLVNLVVSKAEGNPFFLEELARAIREQMGLTPSLVVPDTIEEVLRGRIDRLPEDAKQMLEVSAVVGKNVSVAIVRAVTDVSDETVRAAFDRLKDADFLYETGAGLGTEYSFKHTLTQEATYGYLLVEQRRALHARIMEAIERLHPDRLAEHAASLAHHAFQGAIWDKAVAYMRQTGVKAIAGSAHREAIACFQKALVALGHLAETRATLAQAIDLRLDLRTALLPLGEFGPIVGHLREAESLAKRIDDQPRLGRVCCYLTDYYRQIGDHDHALEFGECSLRIADAHGDFALHVATNIYLGHVNHDMGRYRQASHLLRRNVQTLAGPRTSERFGLPYVASVHSRTWLVFCLAELGEFAEGVTRAKEAVQIAESVEHSSSLTSAYSGLGRVYLRQGDLQAAIPVLEHGLELARTWNFRLLLPLLAEALGSGYALLGRLAEALPLLEEARQQHSAMRGTAAQSIRVASLSQAYLLAGRMDEALQLAGQALEFARVHDERGNQAYALRLLGEIASCRDPVGFEEAESYFHQAIALTEELEMRPLLARSHFGLGKLHQRMGRPEARRCLIGATTLFREMGMRWWLQQGEAELTAAG